MKLHGSLAVGSGAAVGARFRWRLGAALGSIFPTLPPGTLAANLIAGFLIGVIAELLEQPGLLPPEFRWFAVTGLLGGLSTFSTFSSEVITPALREQYGWRGWPGFRFTQPAPSP